MSSKLIMTTDATSLIPVLADMRESELLIVKQIVSDLLFNLDQDRRGLVAAEISRHEQTRITK